MYWCYIQLQSIRAERFPDPPVDSLAGRLLACVGFGLEGAELALATAISGGTFLGIDPSSEHLKAALRNGACDFMVNTLDESLRVLKNELRKKKVLSVGLLGEAAAMLPAMVERGVQPDLVAESGASDTETARLYQPALLTLVERGAVSVDTHAAPSPHPAGFIEVLWTAASLTDLLRMDALALRQLPVDDSLRRRWLQQAPSYFHRQRPLQRVLAMHPEEVTRLAEVFKNAISAGEIQPSATLHWQKVEGASQSVPLQRP